MSGDTIFMTTGYPILSQAAAASSALLTRASPGVGTPYAAKISLPSDSVSESLPSALALARTFWAVS